MQYVGKLSLILILILSCKANSEYVAPIRQCPYLGYLLTISNSFSCHHDTSSNGRLQCVALGPQAPDFCQQRYDRICSLDIRHRKSSRNSEYFPDQPLMYERFRKEKIVEVKIHRLRNTLGTGTFQNGAWNARHAGCYCDVSRWHRIGTDTPTASFLDNMHRPPTNTQNSQRLNQEASPSSTQLTVTENCS